MAKLVVLILGLVAVAVAVKVALAPTATGDATADAVTSGPARQLDHVRTRAQELQRELQEKADRADATR
jgi:hypothetical protein